ncbi:MAG: AAA family ATPase [bacterium]
MKTIKIFLASSAELKSDREQFEIFINRQNNRWVDRGVFLKLIIWEGFLDAMSQTRLQDEYNKAIRECDLFVMLFCTKVGKYTAEEFETAFGQFQATSKPLIFTYFKDAAISTGSANKDDLLSLWAFQEKLKQLGHFQTVYKNIEGLRERFDNQLDKLADDGFIGGKAVNDFAPQYATTKSSGERKIPHNLTKPPFLPEKFLGRAEELQAIKDKLFAGNHLLLLVNGEGGIGKTSLASHYYHTYQNEYAHVAWLLSGKNIANALLALAGSLALKFEDTMPPAARLDLLLTDMAELAGPCLLVIDNANELDDLETNYLNLRRCPNFHALLTTRITEFSQAESYRIDSLPEAEALQLFRTHYPGHRGQEDALFRQIRIAVGGNTLVIELLAKNLHRLNRLKTNYSLTNLLADLQQKGMLALRESHAVSTGYQTAGSLRKEKPAAL